MFWLKVAAWGCFIYLYTLSLGFTVKLVNSSDFDAIKFSMEYECIWFGSNGSEFYSFDNIAPCRVMKQALPIPELVLYGKAKVPEVRFKEKRILSVDVALISSKKNDNDAACLIINDVTLDGLLNYKANIKLIKVFEGGSCYGQVWWNRYRELHTK